MTDRGKRLGPSQLTRNLIVKSTGHSRLGLIKSYGVLVSTA